MLMIQICSLTHFQQSLYPGQSYGGSSVYQGLRQEYALDEMPRHLAHTHSHTPRGSLVQTIHLLACFRENIERGQNPHGVFNEKNFFYH